MEAAVVGFYDGAPPPSIVPPPIQRAFDAAHDPALGLDRSVCLRDVVEAIRGLPYDCSWYAAFLEREFGGTP